MSTAAKPQDLTCQLCEHSSKLHVATYPEMNVSGRESIHDGCNGFVWLYSTDTGVWRRKTCPCDMLPIEIEYNAVKMAHSGAVEPPLSSEPSQKPS
jgi:hypothetical protein